MIGGIEKNATSRGVGSRRRGRRWHCDFCQEKKPTYNLGFDCHKVVVLQRNFGYDLAQEINRNILQSVRRLQVLIKQKYEEGEPQFGHRHSSSKSEEVTE